MGRSQTTFQKRQRELQRVRRREEKAAKRRARQQDDGQREALIAAGHDPDLVGITPGPHNNDRLDDDIELELDGVGGVIIK